MIRSGYLLISKRSSPKYLSLSANVSHFCIRTGWEKNRIIQRIPYTRRTRTVTGCVEDRDPETRGYKKMKIGKPIHLVAVRKVLSRRKLVRYYREIYHNKKKQINKREEHAYCVTFIQIRVYKYEESVSFYFPKK